ncbi:MAG TPA: metallophosphoesterase [Thermoguttaceae bacterium]|nr:metallophosphoesterase [Thermoguttaceae bacterium]
MKRVAWLTDIHLNFLKDVDRRQFVESIAAQSPDAVLVAGDIGESVDVGHCLKEMADLVRRPIYFVLGNHDFYRGSIAQTREEVTELAAGSDHLVYLTAADFVELSPTTALVGHDGWGDARLGDFYGSDVLLNDFLLIDELHLLNAERDDLDRPRLEPVLNALGDEAAEHFARVLPLAMESHRRVVALTHVPPFREAAWHQGKPSDDDWLPFFACQAVGDCFLEAMRDRPDRELTVLCGHTHGSGETQILENLRVLTGGARYREPAIQRVFEFE